VVHQIPRAPISGWGAAHPEGAGARGRPVAISKYHLTTRLVNGRRSVLQASSRRRRHSRPLPSTVGRCPLFVLALFGQVWREQKKKKGHNGALQRGQRRRRRLKKGVACVGGMCREGGQEINSRSASRHTPPANARGKGPREARTWGFRFVFVFVY